MEIYAKGQLSFLILNCLLERDFYGLDIISEIKARTNGNLDLKKPSVYSNLTRMEKQGQVSSYMQSSDLGPNRRYYSITEKGRQTYQELKDEFERNHFNVFGNFQPQESTEYVSSKNENQKNDENNSFEIEERENSTDSDDFFDFSSLNEEEKATTSIMQDDEHLNNEFPTSEKSIENTNTNELVDKIETDKNVIDNVENVVTDSPVSINKNVNENKSDSVYLEPEDRLEVERYNKKLYDISKDMNKYRKRRSFAEDQIAMVASDPLQLSDEKTKQKVEEFKNSLLENKEKYNSRLSEEQFSFRLKKEKRNTEEEPKTEDDGVFVTDRVDERTLGKAKMIEPPRLRIETSSVVREQKLPAPKRDVNIDPSHKEIISRIYSKSRGNDDEISDYNMLDFDDLTNYYKRQNISFKSYSKSNNKLKHNTNKLYLITSLLIFLSLSIFSGILYGVLFACNVLNSNTNFIYILLPALYLIDVIYRVYYNAKYSSWEPSPMKPQWFIWGITLLSSGVVVGLNFLFGFTTLNFAAYATTLILPIVMILIAIPFRYYLKRYILIKYWK